jgi:hypothetical protein
MNAYQQYLRATENFDSLRFGRSDRWCHRLCSG